MWQQVEICSTSDLHCVDVNVKLAPKGAAAAKWNV